MERIILGCVAIVVCTLLGKSFTSKYSQKLKYYQALQSFNFNLKTNLRFRKDNLIKLLDYECCCKDFYLTLQSMKNCIYTDGSFCEVYFPSWFDDGDKLFLIEYLSNLGKGNSVAEMDFVDSNAEIICEKLVKIKDNNSKFTNLGKKLGLVGGIAVFVLIL